MYQSGIYFLFTILCNCQLWSQNISITSRGDPAPIKSSLLTPFPQLLTSTNLLSVCLDLHFLEISHK